MIKHIVMWNLKEKDNKEMKMEQMSKMKELLEGLVDTVDVLKSVEIGINVCESNQSADIVLLSTFNSLEDLQNYQQHPKHVEVGTYIKSVCNERKVVDFVC